MGLFPQLGFGLTPQNGEMFFIPLVALKKIDPD
jgi:hypothetical protein